MVVRARPRGLFDGYIVVRSEAPDCVAKGLQAALPATHLHGSHHHVAGGRSRPFCPSAAPGAGRENRPRMQQGARNSSPPYLDFDHISGGGGECTLFDLYPNTAVESNR